jgi:hypothetical protein
MKRRDYISSVSGVIATSFVFSTGVSGESSSDPSGPVGDSHGPQAKSSLPYGNGAESASDSRIYSAGSRAGTEDTDTAVLSGKLTGEFSSEVGVIMIGPPDDYEDIPAEILADGSFAATVPSNEPINIAYVEKRGDRYVFMNGNPDVYYISRFDDGLKSDTNVGVVDISKGHLLNIQVVNRTGVPLEDVRTAVRSLSRKKRWWQIYTGTNSDGYWQSLDSPTGIEVDGEVEIAVLSDTGDDRVPDVDTVKQRLTITGSRTETITVDPVNISGVLTFADRSVASNQNVVVYINEDSAARLTTNSDGSFSVNLPPAPDDIPDGTYEIQYYRQGLLEDRSAPIDNYVDMYAGREVAASRDRRVGEITLPEGWLTQVRVVDSDGKGIENATVVYTHKNETFDTTAGFFTSTNSSGNTTISGRTGLYLSGSVEISVTPPDSDEYPDGTVKRELDIFEPTIERIEISDVISTPTEYTDEKGYVDSEGLLDAGADYRKGKISEDTLSEIASAFRSGEPL